MTYLIYMNHNKLYSLKREPRRPCTQLESSPHMQKVWCSATSVSVTQLVCAKKPSLINGEYSLRIATLHRYLWRLHMNGTIDTKPTNNRWNWNEGEKCQNLTLLDSCNRLPKGRRLYDMKVLSVYAFLWSVERFRLLE